jgi:hypothetical protein
MRPRRVSVRAMVAVTSTASISILRRRPRGHVRMNRGLSVVGAVSPCFVQKDVLEDLTCTIELLRRRVNGGFVQRDMVEDLTCTIELIRRCVNGVQSSRGWKSVFWGKGEQGRVTISVGMMAQSREKPILRSTSKRGRYVQSPPLSAVPHDLNCLKSSCTSVRSIL